MATVQFIGPHRWNGVLRPGESVNMSAPLLVQELPDNVNLSLTPCARHILHAPGGIPVTYSVGLENISVVSNTAPPRGWNLNFRMVNRHPTQALTTVLISYCIIT
jgi:hypothetical protein